MKRTPANSNGTPKAKRNHPTTSHEAIDLLSLSALPSIRVQTLRDLLAGRRGRIVRRLAAEGRPG